MKKQTHQEKVFSEIAQLLVARFGLDLKSISKGSRIEGDLGLDSVGIMDALFLLEEKFDVEIVDNLETDKKDWPQTLADLSQLVAQQCIRKRRGDEAGKKASTRRLL